METLEQMQKMDGAEGREEVIFSPIENAIYSPDQWSELIENYAAKQPKAAAKFAKTGIRQIHIWTWKYDTCRFGLGHAIYKMQERYETIL